MSYNKIIAECKGNERIDIICEDTLIAWIHKESLTLRDLKFWIQGEALIQMQQLCWTVIQNEPYPYLWDASNALIDIKEMENGEVLIHIEAASCDGSLFNISDLKVFYSQENQCIVYRIREIMKVKGEYDWISTSRQINGKDYVMLEYTNPLFKHAVGPAIPTTGFWPGIFLPGQECDASQWRKRWQMVVHEREDGVYEGHFHNHSVWHFPWKTKKSGFIGLFDDEVGNPVYHFIGDTGMKGYVEQCTWGYDLHFVYLKECEELLKPGVGKAVLRVGELYVAEYEITALTQHQSRSIIEQVVIPPLTDGQKQLLQMPVYTAGVNRFDKPVELDNMLSFAWGKSGEGAEWDRDFGYDDSFSLRLCNVDDREISSWMIGVGQEFFMQRLEPGRSYSLSAYLFYEGVNGEGFRMGVGYGIPIYPGKHGKKYPMEYTWSEPICGSDGWKYVEIITHEVPEPVLLADIVLKLEGKGRVSIDNVEFKPVNS